MAARTWTSTFDWLTEWRAIKQPGAHAGVAFGNDNLEIIDAPKLGSGQKALRVWYPAGSFSPRNGPIDGGTQFYGPLIPDGAEWARLTYKICFPSGFNWVKGGKLPGLYGGIGNTGSNHPDGTDGFTTRCMWRENGKGIGYPFVANTPDKFGTTIPLGDPMFEADGNWHEMRQEVRLNESGKQNGAIIYFYDGRTVGTASGLEFRTVGSLRIEGVLFQTFFGGGTADWATPDRTHVDFAGFRLDW